MIYDKDEDGISLRKVDPLGPAKGCINALAIMVTIITLVWGFGYLVLDAIDREMDFNEAVRNQQEYRQYIQAAECIYGDEDWECQTN